jgi:hypothetical protein
MYGEGGKEGGRKRRRQQWQKSFDFLWSDDNKNCIFRVREKFCFQLSPSLRSSSKISLELQARNGGYVNAKRLNCRHYKLFYDLCRLRGTFPFTWDFEQMKESEKKLCSCSFNEKTHNRTELCIKEFRIE